MCSVAGEHIAIWGMCENGALMLVVEGVRNESVWKGGEIDLGYFAWGWLVVRGLMSGFVRWYVLGGKREGARGGGEGGEERRKGDRRRNHRYVIT